MSVGTNLNGVCGQATQPHLVDEFCAAAGARVAHDGAASSAMVLSAPKGKVGAAEHARIHRHVRDPLTIFLQWRHKPSVSYRTVHIGDGIRGTMCMRQELSIGSFVRVFSSGGVFPNSLAIVNCFVYQNGHFIWRRAKRRKKKKEKYKQKSEEKGIFPCLEWPTSCRMESGLRRLHNNLDGCERNLIKWEPTDAASCCTSRLHGCPFGTRDHLHHQDLGKCSPPNIHEHTHTEHFLGPHDKQRGRRRTKENLYLCQCVIDRA